jgi:hypothetical protein
MMRNFDKIGDWISGLFEVQPLKHKNRIVCVDEKFSSGSLLEKIIKLEDRIKVLEEENISTTNELYRLENSLDARIDILAEKMSIKNV